MSATPHSIRNPFHEFGPSLLQIAGAAFFASFAALWLAVWLSSSAAMLNVLENLKQRVAVPAAVHQAVPSTGTHGPSGG
jgi:hypothetical protein